MMAQPQDNVVLIGMAGAGKSTVGILLAKELCKNFVDTDVELQRDIGCSLQAYLDENGYQALRDAEKQTVCRLQCRDTVISTGGSVIYSEAAVEHLRENGRIVYLEVPYATVRLRVQNQDSRGIAAPKEMTLEDVYREREPMYRAAADIVVSADQPVEHVLQELMEQLSQARPGQSR